MAAAKRSKAKGRTPDAPTPGGPAKKPRTKKPRTKKPRTSARPRVDAKGPIIHLSRAAVEALHRESLAEHGGLDGLRDEGLLESALGRCVNKAIYEPESSLAALAASLAFGLAKNHAFNDGNKRIALIASFTFLELNRVRVTATEAEAYAAIYGLAAGELSESELATWFEEHSKARRAR
jgi:death-on-curing protein